MSTATLDNMSGLRVFREPLSELPPSPKRFEQIVQRARMPDAFDGLTRRQREVCELVGQCLTRKQIARQLGVSLCTVDVHITAAYDRLEIHSQVELGILFGVRAILEQQGAIEP